MVDLFGLAIKIAKWVLTVTLVGSLFVAVAFLATGNGWIQTGMEHMLSPYELPFGRGATAATWSFGILGAGGELDLVGMLASVAVAVYAATVAFVIMKMWRWFNVA